MTTAQIGISQVSDDDGFPAFIAALRKQFASATANNVVLFKTNATGLYDTFLDKLPPELRQHYTCRSCRSFVDTYGGLVTIDENGVAKSALWFATVELPEQFRCAVATLESIIADAAVIGVFVSSDDTWGTTENFSKKHDRLWTHLSVKPQAELVFFDTALKSADQEAAVRCEERGMLARGLGEFNIETVRKAYTFLESGQLFRSEKHQGVAKWLLDLHENLAKTRDKRRRENLIWRTAATAPTGFCHIRSGMLGTLLEDIEGGLPFDKLKRRFDEKMDPTLYQRPQAAPAAGNIAQAEKVIAALGVEKSLERRFATLADVKPLWVPKLAEPSKGDGVFAHLLKPTAPDVTDVHDVRITWDKFQRTVLPDAVSIEFFVPRTGVFTALVTAVHADAPPILQWDTLESRNPVSWYVYQGGSPAANFNLTAGVFVKVNAVTLQPNLWVGNFMHQGEAAIFILDGCRDLYNRSSALFPEILKAEYHAIRSTIEAHSKAKPMHGIEQATACGIRLQKGASTDLRFRVTAKGLRTVFIIDRWD
jgi:hypothetical protein